MSSLMPHNGTSHQERWGEVRQQRKQREEQQRQEQARMNQQQRSESSVGVDSIEALFAKGDQAILGWSAKSADYSQFRVEDHHTDADAVQIVLSALNQMRQERDNAIALISFLTAERKTLRSHITNLHRPDPAPQRLYAKVGLHEACPDFVLRAARTAYRKALHPDGQPERHRADAQRRFIEAEGVFEEIKRLRGR
jgi:hypothetical protein